MAGDAWAASYEAPTSINAGRVLGARPMRATLWTFGIVAGVLPIVVLVAMLFYLVRVNPSGNEDFAVGVNRVLLIAVGPTVLWLLLCFVLRGDFGQRPAEYWLRAWLRHRRLPRRLEGHSLEQHHAALSEVPRGCVEVIDTINLRLSDDETLASAVKRLGVFFNGLRFPVQIVVRAWVHGDLLDRRWFIALTAPTDALLKDSLEAVLTGLSRAGLRGRALNGDLYDTLQRCWTSAHGSGPGPNTMHRESRSVTVDGEHVRGFVLSRMPRVVDPNWLAPLLDGDLAVDFSLWLDPTDNADELAFLSARVNEWETAQILNLNAGGYRDPDIDDAIKDAARTRLLLHRRELRVFRATVGFVVRGATQSELGAREQLLRDQLREAVGDEALIPLDWEHDRAPLLVVPLGTPAVEYPLRTVTPALARGYPFSNSSVTQHGGVDVGTSVGSKRQNTINPFALANPHMVVLGTSGAGKGFWVKVFLWRLLHAYDWEHRINATIIQAEKDEYTALAEALGPDHAEVVRVMSATDLPGLIYPWNGILRTFRSLIVYDLTGMPPGERGKAIAFILHAIEATASWVRSPKHGMVVIDELGIVLESDEAAMAIETAYRRFRSIPRGENPKEVNRRGMIGISQRPSDLLQHPRGRVLADLALTHVYFRQKSTELRRVAGALRLSPDEESFLDEQCDEGTGLLIADRARVGFHLAATPDERRFAET